MLLRRPVKRLSFHLFQDLRPEGELVKEKGLTKWDWGVGYSLVWQWVGANHYPEAEGCSKFLCIDQCLIQETETTLDILSRKGFNKGYWAPTELWEGPQEQILDRASRNGFRDNTLTLESGSLCSFYHHCTASGTPEHWNVL